MTSTFEELIKEVKEYLDKEGFTVLCRICSRISHPSSVLPHIVDRLSFENILEEELLLALAVALSTCQEVLCVHHILCLSLAVTVEGCRELARICLY